MYSSFGRKNKKLMDINLIESALAIFLMYSLIRIMINTDDKIKRKYVLILIGGSIVIMMIVFVMLKIFLVFHSRM